MKDNSDSTIDLILNTIDSMADYLLKLKGTTQLHHKYYGVVFTKSHDPRELYRDPFDYQAEIDIYKSRFMWFNSKQRLFRSIPDAMASAARISYYHCTKDIQPKLALDWLIRASELKGILDHEDSKIKLQRKGPAHIRRAKKSTVLTKQACLLAMHSYKPEKPGLSRRLIIESCADETEYLLNHGGHTLSCSVDELNQRVSVWLNRDNTFKSYFDSLLNIIQQGKCPKDHIDLPDYDKTIQASSEFLDESAVNESNDLNHLDQSQ